MENNYFKRILVILLQEADELEIMHPEAILGSARYCLIMYESIHQCVIHDYSSFPFWILVKFYELVEEFFSYLYIINYITYVILYTGNK